MKTTARKLVEVLQTPVFPKTLHRLRPNSKTAAGKANSPKRDNIFSQSRDLREDRGTRQIKAKLSAQTLFRICALL